MYARFRSVALYNYCPNGASGAVTLEVGRLMVCLGWARDVRGLSVCWGARSLVEWIL